MTRQTVYRRTSPPLIFSLFFLSLAISCGGGSAPPPQGFTVYIEQYDPDGVPVGYSSGDIVGQMQGSCGAGCTGSSSFFDTGLLGAGESDYISTGYTPAVWAGQYTPFCGGLDDGFPFNWDNNGAAILAGQSVDVGPCNSQNFAGNGFFLSGSTPTTLTVPITGGAFSSQYGMPQIAVFSVAKGLLSWGTATSVGTNGTSATFNFPKNSNGTALGSGEYGFIVSNRSKSGIYQGIGGNFLSIGTTSSYTAPYGVDAANRTSRMNCPNSNVCTSTYSSTVAPLVTLSSSSQVTYQGHTVTVGSQPVAVKSWDYQTIEFQRCDPRFPGCITWIDTGPTRALVANAGSGTVSFVTMGYSKGATSITTTGTATVGTQPVAILLDGSAAYAYVANLGSGTVSQINLSTNTVSATVNVGSNPTSLALDPSGTAFWVGGLNYIAKVGTSPLSVIKTYSVTGQVTSLSVSAGQNAYVYTILSGTTFQGAHAELTTGVAHTDYQIKLPGGSPVRNASGGALPSWIQIGGPLVSASYSNRYIVEGTPTGFVVLDLQTGTQMLQGSTSSPIVGIGVDPQEGTVFATESAANTLVTIPLPPVQTN